MNTRFLSNKSLTMNFINRALRPRREILPSHSISLQCPSPPPSSFWLADCSGFSGCGGGGTDRCVNASEHDWCGLSVVGQTVIHMRVSPGPIA